MMTCEDAVGEQRPPCDDRVRWRVVAEFVDDAVGQDREVADFGVAAVEAGGVEPVGPAQ